MVNKKFRAHDCLLRLLAKLGIKSAEPQLLENIAINMTRAIGMPNKMIMSQEDYNAFVTALGGDKDD